jgi:hypothetical protein
MKKIAESTAYSECLPLKEVPYVIDQYHLLIEWLKYQNNRP